MANQKERGPVVNIPLGPYEIYAYDQAVHHHPVYAGFLSRTPMSAYAQIDQNLFLQYCAQDGRGLPINNQGFSASAAQLKPALTELQVQGAHYVLVHKKLLIPKAIEQYDQMLRGKLGLIAGWDDDVIRAYLIPKSSNR